jgi:hypothetical protein
MPVLLHEQNQTERKPCHGGILAAIASLDDAR